MAMYVDDVHVSGECTVLTSRSSAGVDIMQRKVGSCIRQAAGEFDTIDAHTLCLPDEDSAGRRFAEHRGLGTVGCPLREGLLVGLVPAAALGDATQVPFVVIESPKQMRIGSEAGGCDEACMENLILPARIRRTRCASRGFGESRWMAYASSGAAARAQTRPVVSLAVMSGIGSIGSMMSRSADWRSTVAPGAERTASISN